MTLLDLYAVAAATLGALDVAGALLWLVGFLFESVGDATLWWGLWLLAAATGAWWAAAGPALMTFLLVRVSGAALLERGFAKSKPGYAEYIARTSAFLPRPPRRAA